MDSLVGYGSDDDGESGRYGYQQSGGGGAAVKRRDDDTNYDDVNMDMSEESQGAESEPELPPAAPAPPPRPADDERRSSNDSRERDRDRDRSHSEDRRDKRRDLHKHSRERSRDHSRERSRDRPRSRSRERHSRERRDERERHRPRRGLLGDRPDDHRGDARGAPQPPPLLRQPPPSGARAPDARDAVSPRFVEQRDRRDRDRERERDRERDRDRDNRPSRRSEERRSSGGSVSSGSAGAAPRERPRGAAFPPPPAHHPHPHPHPHPHHAGPSDREAGDYRPSSYKVNKKLEAMEKMGLQIKTPDGSMATARQLRAATQPAGAPSGYALQSSRALDQVQKRKLLWGNKGAGAAEAEAAKWTGARFAQDSDGKQVSKFMRLMGIKDPAAIKADAVDATQDPNKKQEELFQAMQAQYEVARATTHTMRGVGLGFQRGNF